MEQLTQKLGSGEMVIQELPMPQLSAGVVLVCSHYSLISAGTEGSTVKAARKGLIGKAKERPVQVKQVFDVLRKQGIVQTYRAVMKKLDAYSPLGYSCAGEVIGVSDDVTTFKVGDRVACAGAGYASQAEVVSVPVNQCVRLEQDANLSQACYNTLGAIALQGVQQADLKLGETCAVIGKGKPVRSRLMNQDKGQQAMMQAFFDGLRTGKPALSMREITAVTMATFACVKSLQEQSAPVAF